MSVCLFNIMCMIPQFSGVSNRVAEASAPRRCENIDAQLMFFTDWRRTARSIALQKICICIFFLTLAIF